MYYLLLATFNFKVIHIRAKIREIKLFIIIMNLFIIATLFSVHNSLLFVKESNRTNFKQN